MGMFIFDFKGHPDIAFVSLIGVVVVFFINVHIYGIMWRCLYVIVS